MKKLKLRILSAITALSTAFSCMFACLPAQTAAAESQRIVVSLGDSYSSGEGIEPFYGQNKTIAEKVKSADWLAHRSENSWAGMLKIPGIEGTLSQHKDTNWFFVASSGAETKHLHENQEKVYNRDDQSGAAYLYPQDRMLKKYSGKIDYVTFTMGGNDIGFVDIMTATIKNSAEKLKEYLEGKLQGEEYTKVRSDIKQFYKDVASLAGPQAAIIVAGYPTLFNSEGFTVKNVPFTGTLKVSAEKAKIINKYVDKFNSEIESLVDECRAEGLNIWFAPVDFRGHEAYTADPYINEVSFKVKDQDINVKGSLSAYSMHPNKAGAKAYAAAVQKVIDAIESGTADTKPAASTTKTGALTLKGTANGSSLSLTWNAVSGASEYTLYQYKNNGWTKLTTTRKTSAKLNNLANNKTYRFMVRANVGGTLTAKTDSCQLSFTACYKPVLTTTSKSGKITMKWSEVNNATKYGIFQYTNGSWKQLATTTKLSCTISARSGKTYRLGVKALVGGKWTDIDSTSESTVKVN